MSPGSRRESSLRRAAVVSRKPCDRVSPPSRGVGPFRPRALGVVALLASAGLAPLPAAAVTVVVPDDFSTVSLAIASAADTVLVRGGDYGEIPLVERNVFLRGIGQGGRPRLAGLRLTNRDRPAAPTTISGFDVSTPIVYTNAANKSPITVNISDCTMGGLQVNADDPDAHCCLYLRRCRLSYAFGGLDYVAMESDTVDGGVSWKFWSRGLSIQHCWFRGGTGAAIALTNEPTGTVAHNRIENYDVGISAPESELSIDDNTISRCRVGVQVWGYDVAVTNNEIRSCGTGVYASLWYRLALMNNTIVGSADLGVFANAGEAVAEGNAIGNCAGAGIRIEWDPGYSAGNLRNNTFFNCGGNALELIGPATDAVTLGNNIGFGSGGVGLLVSGTVVQHTCNDWFGNRLGAVSGVAPDPSDLEVDPQFCGLDSADVRLASGSPLADAAGCGLVGARGVGCDVTPTLVQRFSAARVTDGVRIVWEVAAGATASAIWVERAEGANGQAWSQPPMERSTEGRAVVELDRGAQPDRVYRYRLVARDGGTLTVLEAGIVVEAQAALAFGLATVGPSPGSGPLRIGFTLTHAATIEIAVFDLMGRRIATLEQGERPAGTHETEWGGLAPAGVYVVRYRHPGGEDRRLIVRQR